MKYPKSWIDAVCSACIEAVTPHKEGGHVDTEVVLDALNEVGALKEIPKTFECWVSIDKDGTIHTSKTYDGLPGLFQERYFKVREVLDEN